MKGKGTKKEMFIKMFNIRCRKNKIKNESNKCKNFKKTKELKKPFKKMTRKPKMKEVTKNLKRFPIVRN
jgi:hypothetical protein|tara:strand:+ start:205 stop:411 length:207 start_codon:yes stop_codon:yes gene_type:complete